MWIIKTTKYFVPVPICLTASVDAITFAKLVKKTRKEITIRNGKKCIIVPGPSYYSFFNMQKSPRLSHSGREPEVVFLSVRGSFDPRGNDPLIVLMLKDGKCEMSALAWSTTNHCECRTRSFFSQRLSSPRTFVDQQQETSGLSKSTENALSLVWKPKEIRIPGFFATTQIFGKWRIKIELCVWDFFISQY